MTTCFHILTYSLSMTTAPFSSISATKRVYLTDPAINKDMPSGELIPHPRSHMTLAGIEPATFRFVAQHLNHCATAVPYHFNKQPKFHEISLTEQ